MQVSQPPRWLVGGRREVKIVLHEGQIDDLRDALRRADTAFARELLKLLDGK